MRMTHLQRLLWPLSLCLFMGMAQGARITDKLLAGFYSAPDAASKPSKVLPSDTPLEKLESHGDFTKVRLGDGTEGWVESRFITDEKPARIMLLELQAKNSQLQQQLRDAEKRLQALGKSSPKGGDSPTDPELQALKRELADAKAEIAVLKHDGQASSTPSEEKSAVLKQRISALEQALAEAKRTPAAVTPEATVREMNTLRQANQQLQQRLQRIAEISGPGAAVTAGRPTPAPAAGVQLNAWHLPLLLLALLSSFIGGVAFKNYRLAKRYGGFRI